MKFRSRSSRHIFLICKSSEELGLFKQQQTFYQKWRLKTTNLPMVADGSPVPAYSWMWPGWPDRSITGIAAHLKGFLNYWGCCGGKASAPVDSRVSSVSTALIHTLTDAGFSLTLAALGKSIHRGGCIWTAAFPWNVSQMYSCVFCCCCAAAAEVFTVQRGEVPPGLPLCFWCSPHYRATSAQRLMLHS